MGVPLCYLLLTSTVTLEVQSSLIFLDEETEVQKGLRSTNKCPELLKAHGFLTTGSFTESPRVLVLSD